MNWFAKHPLRAAFAAMGAIALMGAAAPMLDTPRADRDWYPYLSRTPQVDLAQDRFAVTPVSDWSYAPDGPTSETYTEASYDIAALKRVWFVLEPQPGSQLAAHTLLLFEFEGDRLLGLTIEARREQHEEYDALAGIFNAFELTYIWASARDLMTRRVVMLDHEIFAYPVAITEAQARTLLTRLLQRTESLESTPRFYNTLLSNCTNELAKAADFHWAPAFILTGRSDEYLFRVGLIDGPDFSAAHARSDVTEFVRALNAAPPASFDAALLTELRRRNGVREIAPRA